MIYELRVYRCMPGRKGEVLARFRDHVMKFFTKHGIHVVGFWDTVVGDQDELLYITRYASFEDRERRWAASGGSGLAADPRQDARDTDGSCSTSVPPF